MGYYRRRSYRSWRSRGYGETSGPSKYTILLRLFGPGVGEIRQAFLALEDDALDELFTDYGSIYQSAAESYARKTHRNWKSGVTKLSGQTMERLVELVPPYLTSEQRFSILKSVLKLHKKSGVQRLIRINVKEPAGGVSELQKALASMSHNEILAHLPEHVLKAATWLWDDDITSARAMLAEAERIENDLIRASASKEIELLTRAISSGQVKSASYSVAMPAGNLSVLVYSPSKCYVATVCFGSNSNETKILRNWRDLYLTEKRWGRSFIVWYYQNGERISTYLKNSPALASFAKFGISMLVKVLRKY